jgi:hypothetical protein
MGAFKTILLRYISIQGFKRSFMGALKDLYSPSFYKNLANALVAVMPSFNKQRFVSQIFTDDFNDKELKARMRHTSEVLHNFMPADFKTAANILEKRVHQLKKTGTGEDGLAICSFPTILNYTVSMTSNPLWTRWRPLSSSWVANLL